ncbi:MAG: tetratricopeptide repeat protein [Candidatus Aminicenantes bacterium]|nr:tetratricopeptide repeat protein [Candidatus Aminicenantes bacterium]
MKKTERHHLKGDEFVHGMERFIAFARQWRKEFITGAALIAGLALLFAGLQVIRGAAARRDSRMLGEILKLRAEAAGDEAGAAKLEAMAERGKYGRLASISLATLWIEKGDLDKAQAALSGIKGKSRDFLAYQARDLAAQIAVMRGEYDRAIGLFKAIEAEKPKEYVLEAVLFHRAEALEKRGDLAEALELYRKVEKEYAQSYFGYEASLKVRKLEAAG